ncbi:hypothetical protein NIES4101_41860 [Calothrix sp. NIES-4101]|nr:hypothetical protein NIES4101_41860 [Calothrix sp. NIES-4101]
MNADLKNILSSITLTSLKEKFQVQDEFLVIENFLPQSILNNFITNLPQLNSVINRNYIPNHKKGGSVSKYSLDNLAPLFKEFYNLPFFLNFLREITGEQLLPCPADDAHSYALYYYTEPGDHIQYHYDTSYYKGKRFTVLLGLVDNSSCKLEYQLYRRHPNRETQTYSLTLNPGTLVVFNGDKLYHRVTPLGINEERIVLTLEYVTNTNMGNFQRFISNMKDAIAYFGFRQVFLKPRIHR